MGERNGQFNSTSTPKEEKIKPNGSCGTATFELSAAVNYGLLIKWVSKYNSGLDKDDPLP